MGELSIADKQLVAIARAVSTEARVVIFDEPTSSLTRPRNGCAVRHLGRLRERGLGVIYISHRMEEIFRLCDRVTVFRDGRYIGTREVPATNLPEIITIVIGREIGDLRRAAPARWPPVLEVRDLSKRGVLDRISFTVRAGEIVGLAGLVGAGRTELARAIFGDLGVRLGRSASTGSRSTARLGRDRRRHRAGPGRSQRTGPRAGPISVQQNIGLPSWPRLARLGLLGLAGTADWRWK